jgi:hypothetical protein
LVNAVVPNVSAVPKHLDLLFAVIVNGALAIVKVPSLEEIAPDLTLNVNDTAGEVTVVVKLTLTNADELEAAKVIGLGELKVTPDGALQLIVRFVVPEPV